MYILEYLTGGSVRYLSDITLNSLASRSGFGYFLVMLLPLSVALVKVNHNRRTKGALLILSFLTAASILLTADKLILTAAYIALSVYILLSSRSIITTMFAVCIVTIVISFVVPYVPYLAASSRRRRSSAKG
jgi:hypothetical protein